MDTQSKDPIPFWTKWKQDFAAEARKSRETPAPSVPQPPPDSAHLIMERKARMKATRERRKAKNPQKYAAYKAVGKAVAAGQLPRAMALKCEHCGKPAQGYHHHKGYAPEHAPDVVPLCDKCHRAAERQ